MEYFCNMSQNCATKLLYSLHTTNLWFLFFLRLHPVCQRMFYHERNVFSSKIKNVFMFFQVFTCRTTSCEAARYKKRADTFSYLPGSYYIGAPCLQPACPKLFTYSYQRQTLIAALLLLLVVPIWF